MADTLKEKCFAETFVAPQWLPGGNLFWYCRQVDTGKFKFILVDILAKFARPAFDHHQLACALEGIAETKINPEKLPFSWVELQDSLVRFRFKKQIWQYEPGQGLKEWPGEFTQGNTILMRSQEPSGSTWSAPHATASFVNTTRARMSLFTVDRNGKSEYFMPIPSGKTVFQKTKVKAVWRIEDEHTGQLRGIYCVPSPGNNVVHWRCGCSVRDGDEVGEDGEAEEQQVTLVQEELSGDGRTRIYVRGSNMWLKDEEGTESLLAESSDPKDSRYDKSMLYISPNNDFAVAWQYTSGSTTDEYWVEYDPDRRPHPRLIKESKRFPKDRLRVDRPRLFNLASKCEVPTENALFSNHYQLHHLGWSRDGSEYRFLFDGRGHQVLKVLGIHRSGSIRVLYEEKSRTFIDITSKLYYTQLSGSDNMIWASERDGHNHLYLIDLQQGKIHSQITKGDWNVAMVERVDEETQTIWLSAYGFHPDEDPYHLHLVRVNFDGTGCRALTDGDGTHVWSWPFDTCSHRFFVDSWSRVDLPPQTVVRCSETGIIQLNVEGISAEELKQQGWVPPERFHCPGRDGKTLIYGIITKPLNFDETRDYPVIESIYAGPFDFFTPKSFGQVAHNYNWATEGYVSVQLDGMGTNWRSKQFHDVCYKNLNDGGFPDRIIWIKEAAKTRPWMNLDRMAIIGSSAGGHNAASALLHFGHFYKVAVSDSGAHDNSLVALWWAEQWLGYPVDDALFAEQSNEWIRPFILHQP
ncbi:unnamed protein product, partial [Clonostachys solani]